jgi:AcrR family transcriptional regulator
MELKVGPRCVEVNAFCSDRYEYSYAVWYGPRTALLAIVRRRSRGLVSFAMKSRTDRPVRKVGRPLSFDRDAALDKAMHLFWQQGYEGTSLSELTEAMGISPPSLYAAFGDKKQLFFAAIERYMSTSGSSLDDIRNAPTAREAVECMLRNSAISQTQRGRPPGCLLVSGAVNLSSASQDVRNEVARLRSKMEKTLRDRIKRGIEDGELPPDTDASSLAAFYISITHGMSMQAQDGAKRERLFAIADNAMRAWPAKS